MEDEKNDVLIPDKNKKYQAVVTCQIQINQPMSDGNWIPYNVFTDNYNVVLNERGDEAVSELKEQIEKMKENWRKDGRLICFENLLIKE
jgi:flagellar biosynthesis chaperone FliJ